MQLIKPLVINLHKTTVFIACPAGSITGGPELLHQLSFTLGNMGVNTKIVYIGKKDHNTPDVYKKYNVKISDEIIDDKHNILIVPEVKTRLLSRYRKIQKAIWWLSVDNYLKNPSIKAIKWYQRYIPSFNNNTLFMFTIYQKNIKHIVQSYYASKFIENKIRKTPLYLSDYLNDLYLNTVTLNFSNRLNRVFFNPKKNSHIIDKLKATMTDIEFVPLINMTPLQIINILMTGKLYIDFGPHPGKDRIPREAATLGCCIITGRKGSAKYYEDVPIPLTYKINDDADIDNICEVIHSVIDNYETRVMDFENYRNVIKNEKNRFTVDIKSVFRVIK